MPEKVNIYKEGLVIKSTGSWYTVLLDNGEQLDCKIKGRFRIKGSRSTNPVAVGDRVKMEQTGSETPVITEIQNRKNYIIRRASKLSKHSQVIAANIDQAILMVSLRSPKTFTEFIDRFLVSAEAYSIPARIVFNKTDIYTPEEMVEMEELVATYENVGYPCNMISAKEGKGVEEVKDLMKDKISLLSGNSGVGKSSLINRLDPSLQLTTNDISDYHQSGKHTTTFAEMHQLHFGGSIIDTPGLRGFGLVYFEKEELYHYFPEIFRHSNACKYNNCRHIDEPGCAVVEAVENGKISLGRYKNYVSLFFDEENKYRQ